MNVAEFFQSDTAFVALGYLLNIVLETLQAGDLSAEHVRTRNHADVRYLINLTYFNTAKIYLAELGSKHTLHSRSYFFDSVVNDSVQTDIHTVSFGAVCGNGVRTDVESDDNSV